MIMTKGELFKRANVCGFQVYRYIVTGVPTKYEFFKASMTTEECDKAMPLFFAYGLKAAGDALDMVIIGINYNQRGF